MDDIKQFKIEEDQLLKTCLEKRFFNVFQNGDLKTDEPTLWDSSTVELFITPTCNLECSYCYLVKYGDKLYPKEINNKTEVIKNINILLSWFTKKMFSIRELELFSGEIWHIEYGFEVLETILSHVENGLKIRSIMIPTNCSFALEEEKIERMQNLINRFKLKGCHLIISCSIEGLVLEDLTRPMKNGKYRDQLFYDRLFEFTSKNNYLFHPMVGSHGIEKWIENYRWWMKMLPKYGYDKHALMMLEVRNNDWTDESIAHLLNFYDYIINNILEETNGNMQDTLVHILGMGRLTDGSKPMLGYSNIGIPTSETTPPCGIGTTLTVRMGDLSIVPCHRLSYEKFIFGQFVVKDNEIVDIEANNTQLPIKVLYTNTSNTIHGCDTCLFNPICMKGCYGEQYEDIGELYMPERNVCHMLKSKYTYLLNKYNEIGLLEYMSKIKPIDNRYIMVQEFLIIADKILNGINELNKEGGCLYE